MESETCRDCREIQRQEEAYNANEIQWSEGEGYDQNSWAGGNPWYHDDDTFTLTPDE
jgi:hypothetical protein